MRRTGTMIVVAALMLSATSGCGTVANLEGKAFFLAIAPPSRPPIPFGGAGADLLVIGYGGTHLLQGDGTLLFTTAALIDLPFSLVGDIMTLPWVTYEFTREYMNPTGKYDSGLVLRENTRPITPGSVPGSTKTESPALQPTAEDKR